MTAKFLSAPDGTLILSQAGAWGKRHYFASGCFKCVIGRSDSDEAIRKIRVSGRIASLTLAMTFINQNQLSETVFYMWACHIFYLRVMSFPMIIEPCEPFAPSWLFLHELETAKTDLTTRIEQKV